jgi:acetyltransferase-like isoleucine patch superfamily enzyme
MNSYKVQKALKDKKTSNIKKYQELVIGESGIIPLIKYELIVTFTSWIPGAIGIFLRKLLYPLIIGKVGKNVIFGRNVTLRHPSKIKIGNNVIIDDNCMIDAKGSDNSGIEISNGCYIGRNSILYCKNGNITLRDNVNIGLNCIIFSSNRLVIGKEALIAADCYIMSGGVYDYRNREVKIIDQEGNITKGPLIIGNNCWLGAKVVVLDGASIGNNSVIGSSALVTEPIPSNSVAAGIPAKVIKRIDEK